MKNRGWNPTRRNRNIGTKKSGYSQNNKLVIPERWHDLPKIFWERLVNPVIIPIEIDRHKMTLLVEPTRNSYIHACTPADIIKVLALVEREHLEQIKVLVLRQPKKKEEILQPVWGRFAGYVEFGRYAGPGIYLEAAKIGMITKWSKHLDPYDRDEIGLLESHGHQIEKSKRGYTIRTTPETVRNTQLFYTLPHEIGHAVDYLYHSLKPASQASSKFESQYIENAFDSKPTLDKEKYADRYAKEFYSKWSKQGSLPFERIYNQKEIESMGLNSSWFQQTLSTLRGDKKAIK